MCKIKTLKKNKKEPPLGSGSSCLQPWKLLRFPQPCLWKSYLGELFILYLLTPAVVWGHLSLRGWRGSAHFVLRCWSPSPLGPHSHS